MASSSAAMLLQMMRSAVRNTTNTAAKHARTYAAEATPEPTVDVPLKLFSLPGKYATALYTTAAKEGNLKKVETDLKSLSTLLKESDAFETFLKNPLVEKSEKTSVLNEICSKNSFQPTTKRFLDLVADNGRLSQTPKILESFEQLLNAHFGDVTVTVTSAQALSSAEEKNIEESIEILMKKESGGGAKKVTVVKKVDKSLLGGLVVEVGDKMIDLSIKTQIGDLEKYLKETI